MTRLRRPAGPRRPGRLVAPRHRQRPVTRLARFRPLRYPLREFSQALRAWWRALGA
ncbi:MAG TPA: hypothetical protein VK016_03890 [Arenimonas sp.]|nr:hypothetical protein [Arenimonas sp.]